MLPLILSVAAETSFAAPRDRGRCAAELDEPFPEFIVSPSLDHMEEGFADHCTESWVTATLEKLKGHIEHARRLRFSMRKAVQNQRRLWQQEDAERLATPYNFSELTSRIIHTYREIDTKSSARGRVPPELIFDFVIDALNWFSPFPSRHQDSIQPVFARSKTPSLDMHGWNPARFPTELPTPDSEQTLVANATPRQLVLNPSLRERVVYNYYEIDKISLRPVRLTKDKSFDHSHKPNFLTEFQNDIGPNSYRLVEVDGVPMLAGPPLKTENGRLIWSEQLAETARTWNTINPFFKFSIGQTTGGEFRVLSPLFRIRSLRNQVQFSPADIRQLDSALLNLAKQRASDSQFHVGLAERQHMLGQLLHDHYRVANFGPFGNSFSSFGMTPLGYYTQRNHVLFSEDSLFRFSNVVKAQLLFAMSVEDRSRHLQYLVDEDRFRDLFETVYWLQHESLSFGRFRTDIRRPATPGFQVHTGNKTSLVAREWITEKSLIKHHKKHGGQDELNLATTTEYESAAKEFFEAADNTQISIEATNGQVIIKYDFATREFGVVTLGGKMITYFQLDESQVPVDEFHDRIGEGIFR
ncbi:MAG: hypothetical protein HRT45_06030 [Bdellovibrionales bacterium]|nr:hypothetical protein [Bdellovibrionales bacterium]